MFFKFCHQVNLKYILIWLFSLNCYKCVSNVICHKHGVFGGDLKCFLTFTLHTFNLLETHASFTLYLAYLSSITCGCVQNTATYAASTKQDLKVGS